MFTAPSRSTANLVAATVPPTCQPPTSILHALVMYPPHIAAHLAPELGEQAALHNEVGEKGEGRQLGGQWEEVRGVHGWLRVRTSTSVMAATLMLQRKLARYAGVWA